MEVQVGRPHIPGDDIDGSTVTHTIRHVARSREGDDFARQAARRGTCYSFCQCAKELHRSVASRHRIALSSQLAHSAGAAHECAESLLSDTQRSIIPC